jgi:hypothetical protein
VTNAAVGRESIQRVAIIDDSVEARATYAYAMVDANVAPLDQPGPLPQLDDYVTSLARIADAALCDYHMAVHDYSNFDGAKLAAACYQSRFPVVLCTKWERAHLEHIRMYRRWIPSLLKPADLKPERFLAALDTVLEELNEGPRQERRPWHALVRVAEVDADAGRAYVQLPGWHSDEVIGLSIGALPAELQPLLAPESRHHAEVNLGAEDADDLYFSDWEIE